MALGIGKLTVMAAIIALTEPEVLIRGARAGKQGFREPQAGADRGRGEAAADLNDTVARGEFGMDHILQCGWKRGDGFGVFGGDHNSQVIFRNWVSRRSAEKWICIADTSIRRQPQELDSTGQEVLETTAPLGVVETASAREPDRK